MAHMTVAAKADFPLYAMRMKDFLALEELRPHNDLVKAGIVVPMESVPDGDSINFVSHQWLGFKVADPKNEHLRTMQAVFRLCGGDDPTQAFRDEEQWTGYSQGMSKSNVSANAVDNFTGELTEIEQRGKSTEDFRRSVGPETSWVWMDYLSIPQTVTCTTEEEVEQSLKGQAAAIRSIPNYVASAHNFFICAPRDATHVDLCQPCNLATWQKRGWCRLEEAILMLTRGGDGRPLYVTENIGAPPKLFTHDSIDRLWMHTQRHASVLTGDFSCCRMEHVVATPDGKQVPIPCDKTLLGSVLTDVLQGQLDELAPVALGDAKEGASFIQNVGASFAQEGKPFFTFFSLQVLKGAILADHAVEQSTDLERWPQYSDGVATEDQAKSYFDVFQLSALDEKNWGEAIFNAAIEGNLPMLRYFHEKLGVELSYSNPFDMTPLLVAARQGNDATVKYICERVSTEDINKTSKKLGLSGLGDAAKCGWTSTVSVLLAAGASTEVCRVNGCTPLLEAAANGNDECVRKLLQGGADLAAKDNDGKDAFALGAASPIGADAVLAVLREFSEAAAGVDGASATGEATAAQADRLAKLADEGTGGGDSGEVTDAGA